MEAKQKMIWTVGWIIAGPVVLTMTVLMNMMDNNGNIYANDDFYSTLIGSVLIISFPTLVICRVLERVWKK